MTTDTMKPTRKELNELRKLCSKLQGVVHGRNLYRDGRRYYCPEIRDGKLMVLDLYTGKPTEYVDGAFTDGNGQTLYL
jgi:hypothetical protein